MSKKTLPVLRSDEDAERFVAEADLTQYDLSGGRLAQFELRPKDSSVSLRLPSDLLKAVKATASERGIPYQRYMRSAIEQAVARDESMPARRKT